MKLIYIGICILRHNELISVSYWEIQYIYLCIYIFNNDRW